MEKNSRDVINMKDKNPELLAIDPEMLPAKVENPAKTLVCPKPKGFGARHIFTVLAFFGLVNILAMNVCLSVVIVAMVSPPVGDAEHNDDIGYECEFPNNITENKNLTSKNTGEFDWDSTEQGIILGAYFYGNIATQIAGGILAEKVGGKWVFGSGAMIGAIASLLTPVAAYGGIGWLIAVRAVLGMGQGLTYTSITSMSSRWIPAQERTILCTIIFSGANVGIVMALPLSGYISSDYHWKYVFYLFGALTFIWFAFWAVLIQNSPADHPRISEEEKSYIDQNTAFRKRSEKLPFPPIIKIFRTPAFIGLLITHMGNNWGSFIIGTEMPTYLNNIQHVSLKQNGVLSALPYILLAIFSNVMSLCADKIIRMKWLSVQNTRKLFNTIGHVGPALAFIGLSFIGCNWTLGVVCLCLSQSFFAATYSGFMVNHMELSPNYAGTLMGITTMMANMTGFIGPFFAGAITNQNQTMAAWRIVFLVSSAIYFVDSLAFIILGKSEVQPWNNISKKN